MKRIEILEPAFFKHNYSSIATVGWGFLVLRCIIWPISFWRLFLIFWWILFDFQCNLGQAGELSIWEFSGVESYHMVYDHFIGNTNCIHTVVFNVEDKPEVQLAQVRYWLHFLQSRVPPVEPLGEYTPFISRLFSVYRRFSGFDGIETR